MKAKAGLLLTTLLTISAGCVRQDWIDRTLVNTRVQLELVQDGAKVTGTINTSASGMSSSYSGPVEGSVSGDVFSFKSGRGGIGELTVAGDDMEGYLQGPAGKVGVSLRRASPR